MRCEVAARVTSHMGRAWHNFLIGETWPHPCHRWSLFTLKRGGQGWDKEKAPGVLVGSMLPNHWWVFHAFKIFPCHAVLQYQYWSWRFPPCLPKPFLWGAECHPLWWSPPVPTCHLCEIGGAYHQAHSVKKMPTEFVKTLSQNASIVGRYISEHQVFTPTILVIL